MSTMILERELEENEEIPVDEYVKDVLLVSVAEGRAPSSTEYDELGRFSETSGRRKFGTWDNTLGVVCSRVFDLRPPIEYSAYVLDQEFGGYCPTIKEFRSRTGLRFQNSEWMAIVHESEEDPRSPLQPISEEKALSDFFEMSTQMDRNAINYIIQSLSRDSNLRQSEYYRHFSSNYEARCLAGRSEYSEPFFFCSGRGNRFKFDNMMRACDRIMGGEPFDEYRSAPETIKEYVDKVHNNLPGGFYDMF